LVISFLAHLSSTQIHLLKSLFFQQEQILHADYLRPAIIHNCRFFLLKIFNLKIFELVDQTLLLQNTSFQKGDSAFKLILIL